MHLLLLVIGLAFPQAPFHRPAGVIWAQRHNFSCWIELDRDPQTGQSYFNWYCGRRG